MVKRLIDADALMAQCDAPNWCVWMSEIDMFPTVDAIPVDWLKEKLVGHPEIPYSVSDGIITVLHLWEEHQRGYE